MARQSSSRPTNKVIAGSIGAAVTTIGIYVFETMTGDVLPSEIQGAITTVVTFALGYMIPPSPIDTVEVAA